MIPRPKIEPSVPCTSTPEPAKGWVKLSCVCTIAPEGIVQTDITLSSTPAPMPEAPAIATTSAGSSSR